MFMDPLMSSDSALLPNGEHGVQCIEVHLLVASVQFKAFTKDKARVKMA